MACNPRSWTDAQLQFTASQGPRERISSTTDNQETSHPIKTALSFKPSSLQRFARMQMGFRPEFAPRQRGVARLGPPGLSEFHVLSTLLPLTPPHPRLGPGRTAAPP